MIHLVGPLPSGSAVGGAGVATSNLTSSAVVTGRVMGVYVKYNDSPPGTTDVTVATLGTSPSPPATTILTRTNVATDGWFYPVLQVTDTTGTPIASEYQGILIADKIKVTIAQANVGDSVDVWLLLGDL